MREGTVHQIHRFRPRSGSRKAATAGGGEVAAAAAGAPRAFREGAATAAGEETATAAARASGRMVLLALTGRRNMFGLMVMRPVLWEGGGGDGAG